MMEWPLVTWISKAHGVSLLLKKEPKLLLIGKGTISLAMTKVWGAWLSSVAQVKRNVMEALSIRIILLMEPIKLKSMFSHNNPSLNCSLTINWLRVSLENFWSLIISLREVKRLKIKQENDLLPGPLLFKIQIVSFKELIVMMSKILLKLVTDILDQ